jgi:hypothetical protein
MDQVGFGIKFGIKRGIYWVQKERFRVNVVFFGFRLKRGTENIFKSILKVKYGTWGKGNQKVDQLGTNGPFWHGRGIIFGVT